MEQILETKEQTKFIIKMDELGRIHIPIQVRKMLNIQEREKLYIYRSGINIILEKSNYKVEKEKVFEQKTIIENGIEYCIEITRIKNSILSDKKGLLRAVDELGRCVIPIEIRKELHISENNILKIYIKDDRIILIKNRRSA